jgi:hypothetical protein
VNPGKSAFSGLKRRLGIVRTPKLWALYVGLAGFVAEQMADGESEPWTIAEAYFWAREDGEISSSDIDLMQRSGAQPTERTIKKTMDYLERYWAEVEQEAQWLEQCAT